MSGFARRLQQGSGHPNQSGGSDTVITHGSQVPAAFTAGYVGVGSGWNPTATYMSDLTLTELFISGFPNRTVSGLWLKNGAHLIPGSDLAAPITITRCRFSGNSGTPTVPWSQDVLGYAPVHGDFSYITADGDPGLSSGASHYAFMVGGNFTLTRANISGYGQGMNPYSGNVTVTECYYHDMIYVPGSGDHCECVLIDGSSGIHLIRSWFADLANGDAQGGVSSAVSLYNEFNDINGGEMTNCVLEGGSYAFYGGALTNKPNAYAKNFPVTGNIFYRSVFANSGTYGPAVSYDNTQPGNTWSNNTWGPVGASSTPAPGTVISSPGPS